MEDRFLIWRINLKGMVYFCQQSADRIVDVSLNNVLSCCLKSILIGIELSSVPTCIML